MKLLKGTDMKTKMMVVFVLFFAFISILQQIEIYNLRNQFKNLVFKPTSNHTFDVHYVDESPEETKNDVITRINQLRVHFSFEEKPSYKWIESVLSSAEREIANLRKEKE